MVPGYHSPDKYWDAIILEIGTISDTISSLEVVISTLLAWSSTQENH